MGATHLETCSGTMIPSLCKCSNSSYAFPSWHKAQAGLVKLRGGLLIDVHPHFKFREGAQLLLKNYTVSLDIVLYLIFCQFSHSVDSAIIINPSEQPV